jgi:predicted amidohydrolase
MLAAVIQTLASADRELNLQRVAGQVEEAARQGARLAVLPEYFAFLRLRGKDPVPAEPLRGPTYEYLANLARSYDLWLVGGSFYQQGPEGKAYNTSLLIDNQGELVDSYQKIHLAAANHHQGVQNAFDESRDLHYGQRLWVHQSIVGALGVMICYDLRFPETTRALRGQGAEVIAAPCAFFIAGGRTHWDAIIRSRAIENQC